MVFDDLKADPEVVAAHPVLARRLALGGLPSLLPRPRTAHKGRYGQVLVVGGERGTGGAALLSAESALRSGAGMVSLATRGEHLAAALARVPEVMSVAVESTGTLRPLVERADVLVVGPGLGQGPWGRALLSVLSAAALPQVWDADALNLLAAGAVQLPPDCVITPHPGEAARLLGVEVGQVQADRPAAALALARRYSTVVVLKGAGSLVASPDGRLALCDQGHPAMATAGLGDVLAGLVGALLAQHLSPFEAAALATWLHAVAGERQGLKGRGLAASDLIPTIRQLIEEYSPCLS